MQIAEWEVERLHPFDNNPRIITDEAIQSVMNSIKKFGWRQPIVANPAGIIIVGHTRFEAAKRMGLKKVPVHVMDVDDNQARAYRVADNRTGELADWDIPLLANELRDMEAINEHMMRYGFSEAEIEMANIDDLSIMTGETEEPWGGSVEGYVSRKRQDPRCVLYFGSEAARDLFFEWLGTQDANYRKQQSQNECYVAYMPAREQVKFRAEDPPDEPDAGQDGEADEPKAA